MTFHIETSTLLTMKRVYLLKRLDYKNGGSLSPHTPYPAFFDDETQVWRVQPTALSCYFAVLPKYVEKVVDTEPVLV